MPLDQTIFPILDVEFGGWFWEVVKQWVHPLKGSSIREIIEGNVGDSCKETGQELVRLEYTKKRESVPRSLRYWLLLIWFKFIQTLIIKIVLIKTMKMVA